MEIRISDLKQDDEQIVHQVAELLFEAFTHIPDWLENNDRALAEVRESFAANRISRVALDDHGDAVGWIGGIEKYDGHVWELHPLAVKPSRQRCGIGRALVEDFEEQVRQRGGITVMLGSDDEFGGTSLFGADVYPNPLAHLARIRNLKNHPYEFYQKCGYELTGIVPDANGLGRPDILMCKRVGQVVK